MKRVAQFVLRRSRVKVPVLRARPRLIVFDFDGTVADTFQSGFEILNKLADEFGFRPLGPDELEQARDMRTRQLMKFLGIPTTRMSSIARRGAEELRARIEKIDPLPGVPEALHALHAERIPLGIITSNTSENVGIFLKRHGLEIFEFVHSSSKLFGKARELRKVLKERELEPTELLSVGDETRDIEAAHKAGVPIAAVNWGYNSNRSLAAMNPTRLFDRPEELVGYVKGLPATP